VGSQQRLEGLGSSGLGEVMIEAGIERAAPVVLLTPTGHGDEKDVTTPGRGADRARQLLTVDVGQADVHQ